MNLQLDDYRVFGESGLRVSPICLGAMTFGDRWEIGSGVDEARKMFELYVSKGGNFVDTANRYQDGQSEELVGDFMKLYECRSDIVLATKFSMAVPSSCTIGSAPRLAINRAGNCRKNMFDSLDESLARLKTHYVDILYVHFWDYTVDPENLMRGLDDLVRSGKVRHVAVSDAPAYVVSECNAIARIRGWSPFTCLQYRYNIIDRDIERDIALFSRDRRVPVLPWGAVGQGLLTGKFRKGTVDLSKVDTGRDKGAWGAAWKSDVFTPHNLEIAEEIYQFSQKIGRSCSQVAINWLLQKPCVPSVLVGARTLRQFQDNLGALEFDLTAEQMKFLDSLSPPELGFTVKSIGTHYTTGGWSSIAGKIVR